MRKRFAAAMGLGAAYSVRWLPALALGHHTRAGAWLGQHLAAATDTRPLHSLEGLDLLVLGQAAKGGHHIQACSATHQAGRKQRRMRLQSACTGRRPTHLKWSFFPAASCCMQHH